MAINRDTAAAAAPCRSTAPVMPTPSLARASMTLSPARMALTSFSEATVTMTSATFRFLGLGLPERQ